MEIPVIDFSVLDSGDEAARRQLGQAIDAALSQTGFMSVTHLGIDDHLLREVFSASRRFFSSSIEEKRRVAYRSASENFGYQGIAEEHLDPSKPADLKETFTMRNVLNAPLASHRWPSVGFQQLMHEFYRAALEGAWRLQRVIADTLSLEPDFFTRCHTGENVTLRLLYYPASGVDHVEDEQLGAGEHTDYGLLTLLFQDEVGGLEVFNAAQQWQTIPYIEGAIVINAGDLLERWTNRRYRSTLHRVRPMIGQQERYSIALFADPDSATPVSVLDSCVTASRPAGFPPITAGEHLQQKIEASHHARFET